MTEAMDLPPVLAMIAEVTNQDVALNIARRHGGTRVIVPVRPDGDNWLTRIVGAEDARKIIERLGSARVVDVPLGPDGSYAASRRARARKFDEMLNDPNASAPAIARALGVTDRTVRNHRARRRLPDLFD